MPQKHDVGHKKRAKSQTTTRTKPANPTKLAVDLVQRGLASRSILDGMSNRFTPTKGQE